MPIDTIAFNIPGSGVKTITLASTPPNITEALFINGYTQPGASANTNPLNAGINAVVLIELNHDTVAGLAVNAAGSTIRGLNIHGIGEEITVNANNVTTTYGTVAGTGAVSFTNVQSGDAVSTSAATIVSPLLSTSGNLRAGSYAQNVSGTLPVAGDNANYTFTGGFTSGSNYTVNTLALTGAAIAGAPQSIRLR